MTHEIDPRIFLPGLELGQHLSREGEELGHFSVGVPGDDGPVAVVVDARLGELELEGVGADLDRLDSGVLLDRNTILVPGIVLLLLRVALYGIAGN